MDTTNFQKMLQRNLPVNANRQQVQLSPETEERLRKLLEPAQLAIDEFEELPANERAGFYQYLKNISAGMDENQIAALHDKVEPLIDAMAKTRRWEVNHLSINASISLLTCELGRMPTQDEIARKSRLSVRTVMRHLKESRGSETYQQHMEQYHAGANSIMDRVFIAAVKGDLKASKIYLDHIAKLQGKNNTPTSINTQNNYIQINKTVLSQDVISKLKPEQLQQIEAIVAEVVLEKEA